MMKNGLILLVLVLGFMTKIYAQEPTPKVLTPAPEVITPAPEVLTEAEQIQQWADKGSAAYKIDDLMGALQWFAKAADKKHPYAEAMLGYIYLRSDEIERAIPLLERGFAQGEPLAAFELSGIYAEGNGVEPDFDKAFSMLNFAVDKKYVPAYFILGNVYEHGRLGQPVDFEKAKHYYWLGAENGHTTSLYRLITAYKQGELGLSFDQKKIDEIQLLFTPKELR